MVNLELIHRSDIRLFRQNYRVAKRIMDLGFVLLALPFIPLILGLAGIAIYVDNPGPIFYTQLRTGKGGKRFKMYKLRTMKTNAEDIKEDLAHLNELTWPDFKIPNDPRITRVGRILRKTSLDELPQVLNVLRGDMSLVGPRPTSFSSNTYSFWQTERLEVLPGITGLWQVSGRSDVDFSERARLDIQYIEQQNIWLDLMILLRTFSAVVSRRGAYIF